MNLIHHQNYSITTAPGCPLKIHHTSKSYAYLLPASFKGHVTPSLLERIEAICDRDPGVNYTRFYMDNHYANFTSFEEGGWRVVKDPRTEDDLNEVLYLKDEGNVNLEATQELVRRLAQGRFTSPKHIRKINLLFDQGASEQTLMNDVYNRRSVTEFKSYMELMADRSGANKFDNLFIQNISSSTFLNLIKKFSGGIRYNLTRYLACQFLNSAHPNELKEKVQACQHILNLDYLRSEFSTFISEKNHPDLFVMFSKAKTLKDYCILSGVAELNLNDEERRILKNKPFYPLQELNACVDEAILNLSSTLNDGSPLTDTVIIANDVLFYGNSALLAYQSDYFARSSAHDFHFNTDPKGRRIYDLTEECRDPSLFYLLNYMLGKCLLNFDDAASRYRIYKAAEFFNHHKVKDNSLISSTTIQMVEDCLESFSKRDVAGIQIFFEDTVERCNALTIVINILHPDLLNECVPVSDINRKMISECLCEINNNFTFASVKDQVEKIRKVYESDFNSKILIGYLLSHFTFVDDLELAVFISKEIEDPIIIDFFQKFSLKRGEL